MKNFKNIFEWLYMEAKLATHSRDLCISFPSETAYVIFLHRTAGSSPFVPQITCSVYLPSVILMYTTSLLSTHHFRTLCIFLSHHNTLRYHVNAATKEQDQAEHQAMLICFRPLSMIWPRNNSTCQKDIYICSSKCICYRSNIPLLQYFTWAFSMLKLYFQSQ